MEPVQSIALFIPIVCLAPLAKDVPDSVSSAKSKPPRETAHEEHSNTEFSVGEGGRDLQARLRLQSEANMRPAITLTMRADGGPEPALIGWSSTMLGGRPMVVGSITPEPRVELFAGVGVGGAVLEDGICADGAPSQCRAQPPSSSTKATYGTEMGARLESAGPPVVLSIGLDGVASRGWYAGTAVTLETSR
jgi:hypothetical protein